MNEDVICCDEDSQDIHKYRFYAVNNNNDGGGDRGGLVIFNNVKQEPSDALEDEDEDDDEDDDRESTVSSSIQSEEWTDTEAQFQEYDVERKPTTYATDDFRKQSHYSNFDDKYKKSGNISRLVYSKSISKKDLDAQPPNNDPSENSEPLLENVKKLGPGQFMCSCGKIFINRSKVVEHERRHRGIKPFKCDWVDCNMSFVIKRDLFRHHLSHLGVQRYKCSWPGCGRRFTASFTLREHMDNHRGIKLFKCSECDKSFVAKERMKRHYKRRHTDIRPHHCPWKNCGARYAYRYDLKVHYLKHVKMEPCFKAEK